MARVRGVDSAMTESTSMAMTCMLWMRIGTAETAETVETVGTATAISTTSLMTLI